MDRPQATPWPEHATALEAVDSHRTGKLDFVVRFMNDGPMDVSNVVLVIDPADSDGGAAQMSFSSQEAPFTTAWVPRRLASPFQLGAYIKFLRREIEHYLDERRHVKAAKRGLSLARIFFLDAHGDALLKLLGTPQAMSSVRQARRELRARLENHRGVPGVSELASQFQEPDTTAAQDVPPGDFEPSVRAVLRGLLAAVQRFIDASHPAATGKA